jgi:hypothetical protein
MPTATSENLGGDDGSTPYVEGSWMQIKVEGYDAASGRSQWSD